MSMHLEIVTAERVVLSEEVDQLNVPTKDGRVGILPRHAPLLTVLDVGVMDIIKGDERTPYALSGGFMEVHNSRVTILADTVERDDEIDEARAERARQQAQERLEQALAGAEEDQQMAEAELRRAMIRLRVAQLRKERRR